MVHLKEVSKCFRDYQIETYEGKKFLSVANKIRLVDSPEEVCVSHLTRLVKGIEQWDSWEGGATKARLKSQREEKHSNDEEGLYTEAEEADFNHLQGLAGYTDQVTKRAPQSVCPSDDMCGLKLVMGKKNFFKNRFVKFQNHFSDF